MPVLRTNRFGGLKRLPQRAVWEFAASVENWRCGVCYGRIAFEDRDHFARTHLCTVCSHAVNEAPIWQAASDTVS